MKGAAFLAAALPMLQAVAIPHVLWTAPADSNAYEVAFFAGAEGYVEWAVDGSFTVHRTSDKGTMCVRPRKPFVSPGYPGVRLRQSVKVAAEGLEPCASVCRMRFIYTNDVTIAYDLESHSVGGGYKREWIINTPPGSPQEKFAYLRVPVEGPVKPALYISGKPCKARFSGWWVGNYWDRYVEWRDANKAVPPPSSAAETEDAFRARIAAERDHTARVVKCDGFARLELDGAPVPPVLYKSAKNAPERFYGGSLAKEGLPLMVASIRFAGQDGKPGFWTADGFDAKGAADCVEAMMRRAPGVPFVVTTILDAYPEMSDRNPDEVWRLEDGHTVGEPHPWMSNHSLVWRGAAKEALSAFIAELKARGLMKMVVGFHLAGYYDSQFATGYPDFSKAAKDAYARWLTSPRDPALPATYAIFLKRAPFAMLEDLARHVRRAAGKEIVMLRWCMSAFGAGYCSTYDITPFTRSDAFDILVPQPSYNSRSPGYPLGVRLPWSSFHLHGKLLVHELDLRTWCAPDSCASEIRAFGVSRAESPDEWHRINFKAVGAMVARRTGWWYYDMAGGWYANGQIAADIGAALKVARGVYASDPAPWRPDVALLVDEDGILARTDWLGKGDSTRVRDAADRSDRIDGVFAASGVPYGMFIARDWAESPSLADGCRLAIVCGVDWTAPDRAALKAALEAKGVKVLPFAGLSARDVHDAAVAAGAYVPAPFGLQVDMDGSFASVHCLISGRYDFRTPSGRMIPLDLTVGDSRWLDLR